MALVQPVKTFFGAGSVNLTDEVIIFDTVAIPSPGEAITLPNNPPNGKRLVIISAAGNAQSSIIAIDPAPYTFQGRSNRFPLTPGTTIELMFYNGDWTIIGGNLRAIPNAVPISGSTVKILAVSPLPETYVNPGSINLLATDGPLTMSTTYPGLVSYGRTIRIVVYGLISSMDMTGSVTFSANFVSPGTFTGSYVFSPQESNTNIPVTLEWKFFITNPDSPLNSMGMLTANFMEGSSAANTILVPFTAAEPLNINDSGEIFCTMTHTGDMTFILMSSEIFIE
jgi:hypothetical protein